MVRQNYRNVFKQDKAKATWMGMTDNLIRDMELFEPGKPPQDYWDSLTY